MKTSNPWDQLSEYFDTSKNDEDIPDGAADNILIAWPVILKCIEQYQTSFPSQSALDYGCGTGGFAHKLTTLGFEATGIDNSSLMIEKANTAYGSNTRFLLGDTSSFPSDQTFSLITSIMALQFIEDIDKAFDKLTNVLNQQGLFIFAVFNPAYLSEATLKFENGVEIPVFIRDAKFYNDLAKKYGLENILEEYPPFTQEFIQKYPEFADKKIPEYMILGYLKK